MNSTYEKNMQALAQRHPELVARLQQGVDTGHITVKTARSGAPRLLVTTREGEQVLIHNEDDPIASARESASRLQPGKEGLFILLGFGLGYLALEILKKLDKSHVLLICETDPAIFETALRSRDLEPLLLSEQVKVLVGEDISIGEWIDTFSAQYLLAKASLIKYHPCYRVTPEGYQRLEKQVLDKTRALDVNASTLFALGQMTMQNLFANLPWVRRFPGVKRLTNLFAGRPGIVVAAGPSLEKNFPLLKEAQGKAVIIAVDTVLRLLLPYAILPDIVVTLDPQELNYKKFRHLALDKKVPLVCHPMSYPEIIKHYPGEKFVTATLYPMYQRFARFWEEKGYVDVNTQSVGHMAFNLARLLGLDPIIFVGVDLCFPQQKIHAGNLSEGMASLERATSHDMTWTTDIFGERVETLIAYRSFQEIFEQGIQDTTVRCIDATEGGVRLAGTQVMRLRDVIDAYCQVELLDITGMLNDLASVPEKSDAAALFDELKRLSREVRNMLKTSRKILHYVRLLQKMKRAGQTTHPRYARLSALAEKATNYMKAQEDILNLLPYHAYQLELYMSQRHIVDIDDMKEGEKRFERQLERAQVYYRALQGVLEPFAQGIDSLVKHLEAEQALALPHTENGASLHRALQYQALGRYDDAITLFEQCLQRDPTHPEAVYHLGAIYLQQGRYRDALPLIDTGRQLYPQVRGMQQLYAQYQQKVVRWEERLRQARQQGTHGEKTSLTEALLEAGNFYFRVQDLERAKMEYRNVLEVYPHLPEARYHLAHTYFAEEDFATGVAELEEALRLAPDNPVLYRDLGLVACKHGAYSQAERFLQKAIELNPNDVYLYEILGDIYVQSGAWRQAAQAYEALLRLDPQRPDILQSLAVVYQRQIATTVDES